MNKQSNYKTEQKERLLGYMKENAGRHVTAAEIHDRLKEDGIKIGLTTVYRHLDKMVGQGKLARYVIGEGSAACYEYTGHVRRETCYHCKCLSCGKLIHMHCDEVVGLVEHVKQEHGFTLDMTHTVFYGLCSECERRKHEEE